MEKLLEGLGRSFLVAGFAPAVAFLVLQVIVVQGLLARHAGLASIPQLILPSGPDASTLVLVGAIAGGIVGGSILIGLNGAIIHLYEGVLPIQRIFLLPWQRRNEREQSRIYGDILGIRTMYVQTARDVARGSVNEVEGHRQLASIARELTAAHEGLEHSQPVRRLPMERESVKPTALGNAYAVLEEYPFERYGIDSMVFWNRLIAVIPADYLESIGGQKTTGDVLLNFSLLSFIVGLETLVISLIALPQGSILWDALAATLVCLVFGYGLYRAAVGETITLGKMIGGAFDLYRHALLRQLGVEPPAILRQEREIWGRLAAFIRRGEEFYYVSDGNVDANCPGDPVPASTFTKRLDPGDSGNGDV